ncbi:hypothetical protein [Glycomyces paridis]|uniref:Uncharacterized protein n=1 Tax=Glycomyces paridis TaxID=2126555 RepID=A0A4V4HPK2_9ACTN|nr:hypothetical protein [Glycomyces paridis]THV30116.1 hypothetical protein E9998_06980 [Glycomyces paridis]
MNESDPTLTDFDEFVTLRQRDETIHVAISVPGFRQPPGVIANLITELAARLPRPGAAADDALAAGIDAIGQLHRAAATGGYEALTAIARGRLGVETPDNAVSRDPEFDRAVALRLDGVLKSMREAAAPRTRPDPEVLSAEATSENGDLSVTSSTERVIAAVRIDPRARTRGVDGLGEALTGLVAQARDALRRRSEAEVRGRLPEGVAEAVAAAPAAVERAAGESADIIDIASRFGEDLKRKAGRE